MEQQQRQQQNIYNSNYHHNKISRNATTIFKYPWENKISMGEQKKKLTLLKGTKDLI